MTDLIKGFCADLINSAVEDVSGILMSGFEGTLHAETLVAGSPLTVEVVENIYQYIYSVAGALLVLKFLFKGFSIYILWRDGDADSSPQDMVIGAIQAVITVIAFPYLYDVMANVTSELTMGILSYLRLESPGTLGAGLGDAVIALIPSLAVTLCETIVMIVYLVLTFVLYIKLLQRGFELLILRLGVPFACMGLIDSDYGAWKGYIQVLIKSLLTSVVQVVMLSLSMIMVATSHIIVGIAIIGTAFSAPVIMQQFMVPTARGGGITNKIYTTSMAVRAIRGIKGG